MRHERPEIESLPVVPDHRVFPRCIGSGNYGKVWLAQNIMGSFRAIKVVDRRQFFQERPYVREYAGIMKYEPLSRSHPGFVSVLHIGQNAAEHYFYYIMELADDIETGREIDPERYVPKTLATELAARGRLAIEACVDIGLTLTSALAYLHKNNLVHRDIKPSNIIFVDGQPKFADIGLVTDIGDCPTFVGSEGYVPPEGPGKPPADIYALGKVLFEIATGQNQLSTYPQPPSDFDLWPDATQRRRILEVIYKACELNQAKRFQNARDMHERLEAIRKTLGRSAPAAVFEPSGPPKRIVLLGEVRAPGLEAFAGLLEAELSRNRCNVFVVEPAAPSVEWAREVERRITEAEVVIALITGDSLESETLVYELHWVQQEAQRANGRPRLLTVLAGVPESLPDPLAELTAAVARSFAWDSTQPQRELAQKVVAALYAPVQCPAVLDTPGGVVPLASVFYIERPADRKFHASIAAGESIVLIKGARQMGKTSLLARGLQLARDDGHKVMLTNFQKLNAACFESIESFYFALGNSLAEQMDLNDFPQDVWDSRRTPNSNFERYLRRHVLEPLTSNLVWGMDELDRLFPCKFSDEVFGLFRSWHNSRALEPASPWFRLTLAMAYATEAHLFIRELSQSPFNVGTQLELRDFTRDEVAELNRRYQSPLKTEAELDTLLALVGGQPYLTRRALDELHNTAILFSQFEAQADQDDGVFGDHLRRIIMLLAKDPTLVETVRALTQERPCPDPRTFHRLRAAGVLAGDSVESARFRCQLYRRYLEKNLR